MAVGNAIATSATIRNINSSVLIGFDDSSWTKWHSTVTANATTAPDGTNTAYKMTASDTTADQHYAYKDNTGLLVNGGVYQFSCYAKFGAFRYFFVGGYDGSSGWDTIFDLQNGTILGDRTPGGAILTPTSHFMDNAGSGWYKCGLVFTTGNTGGTFGWQCGMRDADLTFAPFSPANTTDEFYIWHFEAVRIG